MRLKQRLMLIAKKAPKCKNVCDIGTDHAYIPICLIQSSMCETAVVTDVKQGPIDIAKKNIQMFGFEKKIQARVGDGLCAVSDSELDTVIIAGMGGSLISKILSDNIEKAKRAQTLILQPMNCDHVLRGWLYDNGFEIIDEELAAEREKIYNVIVAKWTGKPKEIDESYYYIGRKLIENKDLLLEKLLDVRIARLDKAIREMEASHVPGDEVRALRQWYMNLKYDIITSRGENK